MSLLNKSITIGIKGVIIENITFVRNNFILFLILYNHVKKSRNLQLKQSKHGGGYIMA